MEIDTGCLYYPLNSGSVGRLLFTTVLVIIFGVWIDYCQ